MAKFMLAAGTVVGGTAVVLVAAALLNGFQNHLRTGVIVGGATALIAAIPVFAWGWQRFPR